MHLIVKARAKINWTLDVRGTLPNGYHDLDMLLQSVSLCDCLQFSDSESLSLKVHQGGGSFVPADEKNLVMKAALALQQATGTRKGAEILLRKYIPVCAGMGGGSSDAAAALVSLNRLWKLGLPEKELESIGLSVGADVPFCIHGGLQRVSGIGEVLRRLPAAGPGGILAVQPCRGLSTRDVFTTLAAQKPEERHRPDNDAAEEALVSGNLPQLVRSMGNVLQPVAEQLRSQIAEAAEELVRLGALRAMMTGSGTVVYGVFETLAAAHAALEKVQEEYQTGYVMRTLDSGIEVVEEGE